MPNENQINGDTAIILHRLDNLAAIFAEQKKRESQYHAESQRQFVELQKQTEQLRLQTALMQQSHDAICTQVDSNTKKIDRNDLWTKILGAFTGILVLVGTVIAVISQALAAGAGP